MAKIEGGCACGNVRYHADAEPNFSGVCHCKSCQKITGTAFSVVVAIPTPALSISGETKTYSSKGDSGQSVHSTFCPNCGSPVVDTADAMQGVTMIRAGTMDDSTWLTPTMEIYCDSKMHWVSLAGMAQSFPKMPGPG